MADFMGLVESGEYSEEMLSGEDRAFVAGIQKCIDQIDSFADFFEDNMDEGEAESTLGRIKLECARETLDGFALWLRSEKCEAIVCLADAAAAEKRKQSADPGET